MALLLNSKVSLNNGIELDGVYVRIEVINNSSGNELTLKTKAYSSKDAYSNNLNEIYVPEIPRKINVSYKREIDGVDSLLYSHNKIKEMISTDRYLNISGDPSTMDASTYQSLRDEANIGPWIQDSSISIVDVSAG